MIGYSRRACLCTLAVVAAVAACHKNTPPPAPTIPVSLATVKRADVPLLIRATGTVEPIQSAQVQAQVNGQLLHVRFREGDEVHEGQILFELDPRPFEAALAQARGPLSRDLTQLESAQKDLERYQQLASKEYVTQQQLDQAQATVKSLLGMLHSDSAAIEAARLNLQYATIRAPITGRAGSILVKEGNQVRGGAGQTLVVINQISPILVRFPVPAALFDAVRRRANHPLEVTASPVGDSLHQEKGTLVFLDNAVDSLTGTVALKGSFPNRTGALWPGALEAVSLQLDVEHQVLVVPASAVQSSQTGQVVWVVDSNRRAHVAKVKVERSTDSVAVINEGLQEGMRVVTDGQLRLTDSARVSVRGEGGARGDSTGGRGTAKGGDTTASRGRGKGKKAG